MSPKSILLEQLKACHNESNWFVSIQSALKNLSATEATWKKETQTNTIWQIVNHLIFWNTRYLNRFKELSNAKFDGNNDSTFAGEVDTGTEDQWQDTVKHLDTLLSEWYSVISECDEAKLNQLVTKDSEDTWHTAIANLVIHNAYHTGQIAHIRKQQESWGPDKGVH